MNQITTEDRQRSRELLAQASSIPSNNDQIGLVEQSIFERCSNDKNTYDSQLGQAVIQLAMKAGTIVQKQESVTNTKTSPKGQGKKKASTSRSKNKSGNRSTSSVTSGENNSSSNVNANNNNNKTTRKRSLENSSAGGEKQPEQEIKREKIEPVEKILEKEPTPNPQNKTQPENQIKDDEMLTTTEQMISHLQDSINAESSGASSGNNDGPLMMVDGLVTINNNQISNDASRSGASASERIGDLLVNESVPVGDKNSAEQQVKKTDTCSSNMNKLPKMDISTRLEYEKILAECRKWTPILESSMAKCNEPSKGKEKKQLKLILDKLSRNSGTPLETLKQILKELRCWYPQSHLRKEEYRMKEQLEKIKDIKREREKERTLKDENAVCWKKMGQLDHLTKLITSDINCNLSKNLIHRVATLQRDHPKFNSICHQAFEKPVQINFKADQIKVNNTYLRDSHTALGKLDLQTVNQFCRVCGKIERKPPKTATSDPENMKDDEVFLTDEPKNDTNKNQIHQPQIINSDYETSKLGHLQLKKHLILETFNSKIYDNLSNLKESEDLDKNTNLPTEWHFIKNFNPEISAEDLSKIYQNDNKNENSGTCNRSFGSISTELLNLKSETANIHLVKNFCHCHDKFEEYYVGPPEIPDVLIGEISKLPRRWKIEIDKNRSYFNIDHKIDSLEKLQELEESWTITVDCKLREVEKSPLLKVAIPLSYPANRFIILENEKSEENDDSALIRRLKTKVFSDLRNKMKFGKYDTFTQLIYLFDLLLKPYLNYFK